MTFRHPWLLLLLLLVPLLLWLRHARWRRPSVRFSDGRAVSELGASWAIRLQPLLPVLYGLGLTALVLAFARPQKGLAESIVHSEAVDIMLLVDMSPSMASLDFSTPDKQVSRLDAVKTVVEKFVKDRASDRVGMVGFAAQPYTVSPLTLDHDWLVTQLRRFEPGSVGDGTAIGTGIGAAVNRLRESKAKSRLVILLTDGANNMGELTPLNAAQAAKALGIRIYTIGAGRKGMVDMPVNTPFGTQMMRVRSELDEPSLKEIARVTGGQFFRAQDMEELRNIYSQIDKMEKTEVDIERFTRYEELFQPFLIGALCCLALERLLALTRLGRLP